MPAATEQQINKLMGKTPIVPHKMIWRDDDIGRDPQNHDGNPGTEETEFEKFVAVDEIFKRHKVRHTVAIITRGFSEKAKLIDYIKSNPDIDPQVHCHQHRDFTTLTAQQLKRDLDIAGTALKVLFGREATTVYPPYNKSNDLVIKVAEKCGFAVSSEKISLDQYVRVKGQVKEDTVNFHYWNHEDVSRLDQALSIYNEMGWNI